MYSGRRAVQSVPRARSSGRTEVRARSRRCCPTASRCTPFPDEILDVPEDVAALPNLMGFGNMHDLRQAMVRDGSGALRGLVEQYAAEKDPSKRGQIFESLLQKWAGVEGVDPGRLDILMDPAFAT